jgi:hypothetical protein
MHHYLNLSGELAHYVTDLQDYTNFEAYICRAYDGELPEACRGKHLAIAQQTRASRGGKVCLASKTVSSNKP